MSDDTEPARDRYPELAHIERGGGCMVIENAEQQCAAALNELDRLYRYVDQLLVTLHEAPGWADRPFVIEVERREAVAEVERLRGALTVATNRLGNAVGALVDAGTWCEGPHDVTAGIERVGAERDVWRAVAVALHSELVDVALIPRSPANDAYQHARNGRLTEARVARADTEGDPT